MAWRGFSACGQTESAFQRGKLRLPNTKSRPSSVFSLTLLRFNMKMTLISIKIHLKGDDGIYSVRKNECNGMGSVFCELKSYRYSFGDSDKTDVLQWKTIFNC